MCRGLGDHGTIIPRPPQPHAGNSQGASDFHGAWIRGSVSWGQGPSLEMFEQRARAAQPDPWGSRARALTNTRASPAAPMALRNGEQMSHNNHSLLMSLSWARRQWPKKTKNSFSLHPPSYTGPHPNSKWPRTCNFSSPPCRLMYDL